MTNPWTRRLANVLVDSAEPNLSAGYDMVNAGAEVLDLSGNANTMTMVGAHSQYSAIGRNMRFNGVNATLSAPVSGSLKIPSDATVSFWTRPLAVPSGTHILVSYGGSGGQYVEGYMVAQVGQDINVFWRSSSLTVNTPGSILQIGQWYHVAVVNVGGTVNLYVNGEFVDSGTAGGTITEDRTTYIGGDGSTWFFQGDIASVRIFNSAKSVDWVTAQYNQGRLGLWKTEYGVDQSTAAVTGGPLENSPILVDSGSFRLNPYSIDGLDATALECITAGICYIPTGHFHADADEAAIGDFEIWLEKAAGHTTKIGLINQTRTNASLGYGFQILTDGTTTIEEWGVGSVVTGGSITTGQLTKINLKRKYNASANNQFEGFVDGSSFGTGNDETILKSYYVVFECGIGDKIIYADRQGGHAIIKRLAA
jgi:hypothetical protein